MSSHSDPDERGPQHMLWETLFHTILPSSCYSRTSTLPFLLPPTLFLTPPVDQTSAKNFLKGLSDGVLILQCFCSSVLIPAREIQNRDTYSKHKYYCNLMAPVIASSWANYSCKCQGEVRTWKIQEEVGWLNVTKDEFLPAPNPSDCSLPLSAESCLHGWSQVVSSPCSDSLRQRL